MFMSRWNPFEEMQVMQREFDRLFGRTAGERPRAEGSPVFAPAMEVAGENEGWYVRLALPGIDPAEVQVEVTGNQLVVRGERKEERRGEAKTFMSEISYGRFERTLMLPETLDADRVKASFRHGVLELTLPLREAAKPRRIEVTSDERKSIAA
jgi:HSP20 family protein